ncbi:MAG TPA: anti-sigma factor [Solirubrobacteraceae bacterium]|nr:anti-sigma factor [Solirubrobacteraceae bacterium]
MPCVVNSMLGFTRGLRRTSYTATEPPVAPGALRRRVLATVGRDSKRTRLGRRGRHTFSITGAIACAALLLSGTLALLLGSSGRGERARPQASPSARAPVASLRRIGHRGELKLSGMPQPPIGEVYQVWLGRTGRPPQPTDALFTVTSAGSATVDIPGSLRGVREVMVTAEPLGGSASPTGPALLRVAPPS